MGSGGGNASRQAQQAEAERQARIAATTGEINRVYDAPERTNQYNDFLSAVREHYTSDAKRQKGVADRNLKFSMAKAGLSGGSADADARTTLGEEFTRGLLQAEDTAQSSLGDLKASDEASRLQLLTMAQSGLDATTAASRAMANVQQGAQTAKSRATADGLGDIFAATNKTYQTQQEAVGRRAGITAPIGGSYYSGSPWSK